MALYRRIFKEGTRTPEEIKYEEAFLKRAMRAAKHNSSKNYNGSRKKHKWCEKRAHIPIYEVNKTTKEILNDFYSISAAGESINMSASNFSKAMMDRPVYKPVLIKGHWFIKQSHYKGWLEGRTYKDDLNNQTQ